MKDNRQPKWEENPNSYVCEFIVEYKDDDVLNNKNEWNKIKCRYEA